MNNRIGESLELKSISNKECYSMVKNTEFGQLAVGDFTKIGKSGWCFNEFNPVFLDEFEIEFILKTIRKLNKKYP